MATKQTIFYRRIASLGERMAQEGIDALLFSPIQLFYYTGYDSHRPIYPTDVFRLFPVIIPLQGEPFHIVAKNVLRYLKDETWIGKLHVYDVFLRTAEEFIAKTLRAEGLAAGTLGIEEDVLVTPTETRVLSVKLPRELIEL